MPMKITSIITYYQHGDHYIIRKKHNSYSFWNYAVQKWRRDDDAKYLSKTEISEEEALKIIQENQEIFNQTKSLTTK